MDIDSFARVVAEGLEVDPSLVSGATQASDIETWDSLGHLTLLMHLEKEFDGVTADMPELGGATSVKEMYDSFAQKCGWAA
jgi:acyl carrier protein